MKYTFIMNREIRAVYVGRKSSHYHVKTSVFLDLLGRYIYAKKRKITPVAAERWKKGVMYLSLVSANKPRTNTIEKILTDKQLFIHWKMFFVYVYSSCLVFFYHAVHFSHKDFYHEIRIVLDRYMIICTFAGTQ